MRDMDTQMAPATREPARKRRPDRPGVMGRPLKPFDTRLFEELCQIQCTEVEIAAVMGLSTDGLERIVKEVYGVTFSGIYAEKREGGRCSLRRAQWKKATEKDDTIMQIFLGKNYLGQADKQELRIDADIDVTVTAAHLRERARALLPAVDAEAEEID